MGTHNPLSAAWHEVMAADEMMLPLEPPCSPAPPQQTAAAILSNVPTSHTAIQRVGFLPICFCYIISPADLHYSSMLLHIKSLEESLVTLYSKPSLQMPSLQAHKP